MLLCPWDFPGNIGMGHRFLQGIFSTEGSNPSLLHWKADFLPLSHQGSPQLWTFKCSNTICWKGYPSSNELLLKEAGCVCVCLFLVLYSVSMMHVSIPLLMPYCLDYYSCVVNLNSSLIPRMSTFTLAISCLTTSNLSWFMDLTFQVPMQYCSFTASGLASITSHIHNWVLFLLWLHPFILSGVISPLISSSILGIYRPIELLFQYPIILPFRTVQGFSRQEYWCGLPFSSLVDHILSELFTRTLHVFGCPTQHGS